MPGLVVPFVTFTLLYCFLGVIVAWLLYQQVLRSPTTAEVAMPVGVRSGEVG
jgi:hypothetical protein